MFEVQQVQGVRHIMAAAGMAVGLAACGGWSGGTEDAHLVPDEPGIYTIRDDELTMRLDGTAEWEVKTWKERQQLDNPIEFVIYDPAIPRNGAQVVRLTRVGWVRSEIDRDGTIQPAEGNRWLPSDDPAADVPLRVTHVAARADVLRVTPDQAIPDGLYSLQLRLPTQAKQVRFGLQWPRVDRRTYAGANCLDLYVGSEQPLRPCSAQTTELLARGLELHLVPPEQTSVGGARALVVRGVVVNKTDRPKPLPMMEAQLRGADGAVLQRWQFAPQQPEIGQRASVPFQTTVASPPPGVQDVHVRLLPIGVVHEARN